MPTEQIDIDSALLNESVQVVTARPTVALHDDIPWVWLLHGRGSTVTDVSWVVEGLDAAMAAGELGPHVIAAPVGPWSEISWWVDSAYRSGQPVETAMLTEVLPEVEKRFGQPPGRDRRTVAGYSMGGGSAVGWLLRHGELFSAAALAAPAAFAVAPPARSSTDGSGAFGVGDEQFDHDRWASLMSYRRLLADRPASSAKSRVGIVVGDAEAIEDYPPAPGRSSLTLEAAKLHVALSDAPGVTSSLRVIGAGHTWDFWIPAITLALELVGRQWIADGN
jgi:enterochelin esterase-like enzyme